MPDPNQQLIAQADTPQSGHSTTDTSAAAGKQHDAHQQEAGGSEGGKAFNTLLKTLGDHHELSFGHIHLIDLPVILIDDGLHIYPSVKAMEQDGKFQFTHHHIYKAGTHERPAFDMSITSLIAYQWLAMFIIGLILIPMARKYRRVGNKALGGFHNAIESVIVYVRDEVVLPNVGEDGKKLMPIFLTMFFFILMMNLIGLVPGGHTATGSINVTAGLAIIAFFVIQLAAIFKNGLLAWLKHLTGGVPWWIWPIMIPVEVLGLFTKPFALAVRLFANMTAGHVILLSLIGLVYIGWAFIPVTIGFSLFIYLLELLVAFLQAYIFTILMAVFTGIGMASHDHDAHHEHGEHAVAH